MIVWEIFTSTILSLQLLLTILGREKELGNEIRKFYQYFLGLVFRNFTVDLKQKKLLIQTPALQVLMKHNALLGLSVFFK